MNSSDCMLKNKREIRQKVFAIVIDIEFHQLKDKKILTFISEYYKESALVTKMRSYFNSSSRIFNRLAAGLSKYTWPFSGNQVLKD